MKKTIPGLAVLLALASAPCVSHADFTFNVGGVSDYRFRGISQTRNKPALQGGADWSSASGFYVGTWASTIKWIKDAGGDSNVEIDVYGGYKGDIVKDAFTYDVGVLQYVYPGNKLSPNANTTEIYGALTYGPATLKYSHALTNTFANPDSKNSYYLDGSASVDVGGGVMLAPHVGHQRFRGPNSGPASYWDYSLAVSKDFSGWVPSAAVVGNSRVDRNFYTSAPSAGSKYLAKTTLVVGLKYNF